MALQDHWLTASQHRLTFSKSLWQDLVSHYGDMDDPLYWRQRPQRMAYQYAIVDHLLSAAKHLVQASLKQLADTRFEDIGVLSWVQIEAMLAKQAYLSPAAQQILLLLQEGDWALWIELQGQTDFSVASRPQELSQQLIVSHSEDDLADPDHWPVARWLKDMQTLQSTIRESMQEC
jgi:hypothetical protein